MQIRCKRRVTPWTCAATKACFHVTGLLPSLYDATLCMKLWLYAGCCLCIHSSAEGPAVRTECLPPWLHSGPCMLARANLAFHPPAFPILLSFVITLPVTEPPLYILIYTHPTHIPIKIHCICRDTCASVIHPPCPPPSMHAHVHVKWTPRFCAFAGTHTHSHAVRARSHAETNTATYACSHMGLLPLSHGLVCAICS